MKKIVKYVGIIVVFFVIFLVAVAVVGLVFGNRALKVGIETAGTKALNVAVSLENMDLSIFGGKVGFQNLVIDNPAGYQHKTLLELQNAKIAVEIKSLLSDVVNIKEIKLDGVNVVLEQRGVTSNNIQDVIQSLPTKTEDEEEKEGKKLHIDNLEISDITVKAKLLPVPGKADTLNLSLPTITMNDLGGDKEMSTIELSQKILLAITQKIAEKGADILPAELVGTMKSALDKTWDTTLDLGKTATDAGQEIIETGKDIGKGVQDVGSEVIEGFKGLLKPKEDKK